MKHPELCLIIQISEYYVIKDQIFFLVREKNNKHCQEIKQSTEPEDKKQIINTINLKNDITTDSEDIKMIRKYYEQFYVCNFNNTTGRSKSHNNHEDVYTSFMVMERRLHNC